jgi:hypothetical protein
MIETLLSIGFVILFSVLAWAVNPDAESTIWGGVGLVGIDVQSSSGVRSAGAAFS